MKLHSKYGLNPSMTTCFWCGKPDGAIAMLGASYKGEAPRYIVANYDPCTACQHQFAQGILCIEAATTPPKDKRPPFPGDHNAYPTGRFAVITREAAARTFKPDNVLDAVLMKGTCLMDPETFDLLFKDVAVTTEPREFDPRNNSEEPTNG